MSKGFYIVHFITLALIIGTMISLFSKSLLFAAIPLVMYVFIHRKNSNLLYYAMVAESKVSGAQIKLSNKDEDLFFGRELFIIGILNLLVAISFGAIINLFVAAYILYISIVSYNYLNINK